MEIAKVGGLSNYGKVSASFGKSEVPETHEHKEISEKNIGIAAAAITSAGLAAIAYAKKHKTPPVVVDNVTKSLAVLKDAKGNTLGVTTKSLEIDTAKFKALPKTVQKQVIALIDKAKDADSRSKIFQEYKIC